MLVSLSAFSQNQPTRPQTKPCSYTLVDGKVVAAKKANKQADKVLMTVDGVDFYEGARGGVYYFTINKKGEKVKMYVKKQY